MSKFKGVSSPGSYHTSGASQAAYPQHFQKDLSDFLVAEKYLFEQIRDDALPFGWVAYEPPAGLCELYHLAKTRLEHRQDLREISAYYQNSENPKRFLMQVRMMQHDVRGEDVCAESMKLPPPELAKVILRCIEGIRTGVVESNGLPPCGLCGEEYDIGEELSYLPCDGNHYFHEKCVEQQKLKGSKRCWQCQQFVF